MKKLTKDDLIIGDSIRFTRIASPFTADIENPLRIDVSYNDEFYSIELNEDELIGNGLESAVRLINALQLLVKEMEPAE